MRLAALVALLASACGGDASDGADPDAGKVELIGEGTVSKNAFEKAQFGDPQLRSAQRITFGPGGVLLVADGARDRIVAIETGEGGFGRVPAPAIVGGLRTVVAKLYGDEVPPSEIFVRDVAVESTSGRVYLAAERHQLGQIEPMIALFDAEGSLRRLSTESVIWAEIRLPPNETPGSQVVDVAWAAGRVLVVAADGPFSPSTLFASDAPIRHGSYAFGVAPEVYLPVTGQSHIDLPIFAAVDHEGAAGPWLLAACVGAPVARFSVPDLSPGIELGQTVFDLGSGREVRDIVSAQDGDRRWLWLSVYDGGFDGSIRGYRVGGGLVDGIFGINALAPQVIDFTGTPIHPEVVVEPALDGAFRLARGSSSSVVVLRPDVLEVVSFE
jgi:hypothetical protein